MRPRAPVSREDEVNECKDVGKVVIVEEKSPQMRKIVIKEGRNMLEF